MVELPQGVVIEVRRGGHDALAKLSSDMVRLDISGYLRIERRPKNQLPRVSQVVILDGQPRLAIHESDVVLGGVDGLLEIERDATGLDALISLVELADDDIARIITLYPDFSLNSPEPQNDQNEAAWWNYVRLNPRKLQRASRLPETEVTIEAPEYIRQLTKAKLQKFDLGEKHLNYGDTLIHDGENSTLILDVAGILAAHGRPVLVLSRHESRTLTNLHSIPESSCVRISVVEGHNSVNPQHEHICERINNFLWANKQAIVVIADLEYLLSINDFPSFMGMFREINDSIRSSDHLLLTHCNLGVMNVKQRHTLLRELDNITTPYLENLVLDPESLIEHPICMELTEEELSWINQQITFTKHRINDGYENGEAISGGTINLADEDVVDAKEQLNKLVENWQETGGVNEAISPAVNQLGNETDIVSNIVDKAFAATTKVTTEQKSIGTDIPTEENPVAVKAKVPFNYPINKKAEPRPATRIKRTKRPTNRRGNSFSASKTNVSAIDKTVQIPDLLEVDELKSNKQVFDTELGKRAARIDNALQNMLDNQSQAKSRLVYHSSESKSIQSIERLPQNQTKKLINPVSNIGEDARVYSASEIYSSDGSKRKAREMAARAQTVINFEQNYRQWSRQYENSDSVSDSDSIEPYFTEDE